MSLKKRRERKKEKHAWDFSSTQTSTTSTISLSFLFFPSYTFSSAYVRTTISVLVTKIATRSCDTHVIDQSPQASNSHTYIHKPLAMECLEKPTKLRPTSSCVNLVLAKNSIPHCHSTAKQGRLKCTLLAPEHKEIPTGKQWIQETTRMLMVIDRKWCATWQKVTCFFDDQKISKKADFGR